MTHLLERVNLPVVFEREGAIFANSRDVALFFERNHRDVLRAIENLTAELPDGGMRNFAQTPYVDPQNGQTYKSYDLTKDGFVILAMGFTGPKSLGFKLRYIDQFNAMEADLKAPERLLGTNRTIQALAAISHAFPEMLLAVEALKTEVAELRAVRDPRISVADRATTYEVAEQLGIPKKGRGRKIPQLRNSLMDFARIRGVTVIPRFDTRRNEETFLVTMVADWKRLVWEPKLAEAAARARGNSSTQAEMPFTIVPGGRK